VVFFSATCFKLRRKINKEEQMLNSIIAFCLSHRAIVLVGLFLFIGVGCIAYQQLNIEAYPNPTPVILEVTAQAPGLSAEEMERYYTRPIEIGLYTVPGIDVIRSTSFYGLSFVRIVFKYGVDYHFAYAQTAVAIQQNVNLPGGLVPTIQQNSATGEILRYEVVGPKKFGLTNLRSVQEWIVKRRLLTIPGIVQVNSWGGPTKQFDVDVDAQKLQAYNLSVPQVLTALNNANINVGGREIRIGQQSINIRGVGLMDDGGNDDLTQGYKTDDIKNVVLAQVNGVPVLVKDIATVSVGYVPRLGIWGHDKENDAVAGIVVMGRDERAHDLLPKVEAEIDKMNHDGSLPPGVKLVPFYDRGRLISVTTNTVLHNLIFGTLLIFFIQWIFLGDLRSAIIVGLTIPFALFFALIILVLRNESANLLSVGAVDLGIIVDASVILIENIFRNFQKSSDERQSLLRQLADGFWGTDPTNALRSPVHQNWTTRLKEILISAIQVGNPVLFSALITVAAFVPLFTMRGVEGAIFGPMARTYAYALAGALIATFTITPVLSSFLLPERVKETETFVVRFLHRLYNPVLHFALAKRRIMLIGGIVFLALAGLLATRLGSEFLPALEEGNFWIRASMPITLSLQDGEAATRKMRLILMKYPEVITVTSQHGRPDDGSDASPFSNVELFAPLKPQSQWPKGVTKENLTEQIDAEFHRELPGVNFTFSQYIQDNIEEGISGVKGANSVKIIGPNLETLTKLAEEVRDEMAQVPGITDLGIFPILGQPNLNIKVDREKCARYGLNVGDVNWTIQAALGGATATTIFENDRLFEVAVRYPEEYRNSIEKISNIRVAYQTKNGASAYIPLSELSEITMGNGATWIYHENTERFIPIKFSVRGRDLGSTVAQAQQQIAKKVMLPSGYRLVWAGEFGQLQAAQRRLAIIVPITLVIILGILYAMFNSLRECLLVLSGIPFAIAGGLLALYIAGLNFSISAAIGFISLFGVSVMNGILLMTYFNHARLRGDTPKDAMFYAASTRMRSILMISLSACLGLLPSAISTGIGSQVQRPLATVIVGGMLVGPLMLLIVVPALKLTVLDKKKEELQPSESNEGA
jgi:heavy metal efflux system protein